MKQNITEIANRVWQWIKGLWPWYKSLYKGKAWYVKTLIVIASLIVAFFLYLGAVDINFLCHTIIMGRNTFLSLPKGALPNRRNVVLSRSAKALDRKSVV